MSARTVLPWVLAALAAGAFCALFPYRLTDGDSCAYGALAREMAAGTWRAWAAPTWDFHGAAACFHEHPPGAFWASALLGRAGVRAEQSPLVANALWALLAAGGTAALARRLGCSPGAALVAGGVLLLHAAPLRFVQRAGLEFPLAACSVWAVVATLRLRDAAAWSAVLAASLAGAFLVRGALAATTVGVVLWTLLDPALRPPLARAALGVAGAALLLVAFDRAHAAATGHGFWAAYVERQVAPSFDAAGSRHARPDSVADYFAVRLLVYSLPWSLLPLARVVAWARGRGSLPNAAAWRIAAVWILLAAVGPALTSRPASRYLFQAWVPASVLFGLALTAAWPERWAPRLRWAVPLLVVVLAASKSVVAPRDDAWRTAEILSAHRDARTAPARPVVGPFLPEDDGRKSFVRFHLGTDVFAETPAAPRHADRWVPAGSDVPAGAAVLVETPLGRLVR